MRRRAYLIPYANGKGNFRKPLKPKEPLRGVDRLPLVKSTISIRRVFPFVVGQSERDAPPGCPYTLSRTPTRRRRP